MEKIQMELTDIIKAVKKERPVDFEKLLFEVTTEPVLRGVDGSVITDYKSIVNMTSEEVLSVVLKSYSPVSNREIIEFFEKSLDNKGIRFDYGFATESRNGRKTVFEIILPDMEINVNGDKQQLRLYVTNSFDGKTSIRLDMGFFRHACSNMALMIGNADIEYRTSHVGDATDRIETKFIGYITEQYERVTQFVNSLSTASFPTLEYINRLIDDEQNIVVANRNRDDVRRIFHSYYNSTFGLSLWGLYNAYTHLITHELNISEMGRMKKFLELSKLFHKILSNEFDLTKTDTETAPH